MAVEQGDPDEPATVLDTPQHLLDDLRRAGEAVARQAEAEFVSVTTRGYREGYANGYRGGLVDGHKGRCCIHG